MTSPPGYGFDPTSYATLAGREDEVFGEGSRAESVGSPEERAALLSVHEGSRRRRPRSVAVRVLATILAALVVLLGCTFVYFDEEQLSLTEEARATVRQGGFVRLEDGVVHFELGGPSTGPTVVLVHGFSVPAFIWDPTYEALVAAGMRVLRYDLYGRGWSDRPDVTYDAALFDRQLGQLLDALDIREPVNVAGVSMGGAIAVRFADRHPERVRSLVLVDPAYSAPRKVDAWLRLPVVGEYVMDVFGAPTMARGQLDDFHVPAGHEAYIHEYRTQMRYHGFRRAILSTRRSSEHDPDVREAYARVGASKTPVLLVWGRDDRTIPFAVSDDVRRAIPQAEFHPIDDAGHIPQYERPDLVSPILVTFLRAR